MKRLLLSLLILVVLSAPASACEGLFGRLGLPSLWRLGLPRLALPRLRLGGRLDSRFELRRERYVEVRTERIETMPREVTPVNPAERK